MKKIKQRLSQRFNQFEIHPLTKGNELKAMWRYICFHIMIRVKKTIIYKWIGGLKFIAKKGEAGIVGNIYYGLFEFEESIFLIHLLNKQDLFLDIGANVGHYSLLMSGLKQTRSIAIEPVPKTFSLLEKQIELNNLNHLIQAINIGVSNKNGELYFSTDRGTMDRIVNSNYKNSVVVKVETIDSLLSKKAPVAIKMDVEGYEKYALQGASDVLNNEDLKVIVLELNDSGRTYNISDDEVYQMVLGYGFKPFKYQPENRHLIQLETFNENQFNTIFIRDLDFVLKRIKRSNKIKINNKEF